MTSTSITGYVDEKAGTVTTFHGDTIATLTGVRYSRRIWTSSGYWRRMYVQATRPDGSRWYARGTDNYNLITLRKYAA